MHIVKGETVKNFRLNCESMSNANVDGLLGFESWSLVIRMRHIDSV